jgi:DNA-binding NarL/FixJ family response regulator
VLVVEDHAPFRRFICKLLQQRPDVEIVGEAADGWDAIGQAETLRPDMVLLDIGLPRLNGIEAAGRIHAAIPDAKLMFVTIESSLEVVEEAYRSGAHGYVYKPRAHRDVLPVLDAIIRGTRFISGGLARIAGGDSIASHRHALLFYSSDAVFVDALSRFIAGAFEGGNVVIVLVTKSHDERIRLSLRASGIDVEQALHSRYISVDIGDLLAQVMVDHWPDAARFQSAAEELVTAAAARAAAHGGKVVACGECVPTLWAEGHLDAAIQFEHLWDELARSRQIDTLCAYPLSVREDEVRTVTSLCAAHTVVEVC